MNNRHKTAITRKKPSKPMAWIESKHLMNGKESKLDYGCGKGEDAHFFKMDKYDPYFYPELPNKKYDFISCNYVLNVIPTHEERIEVLQSILELLDKDGVAYISVRKDIKKNTATQFKVELALKVAYMDSATIIYAMPKDTTNLENSVITAK